MLDMMVDSLSYNQITLRAKAPKALATNKRVSQRAGVLTKEQKRIQRENTEWLNGRRLKRKHPPAIPSVDSQRYEPYSEEWTADLRKTIRERDKYTCQMCAYQPHDYRKLPVHHINWIKSDCRECNLITLCKYCHSKIRVNRTRWYNHLYELIRAAYPEYLI